MNLMIEFLSANGRYGAGEYHRRVVMSLLERIESNNIDVNLYALYDSNIPISFEDMRYDTLGRQYDIKFVDLQKGRINKIIDEYKIDRLFIACGQRIGGYSGIEDIKCQVVCVTHDLLYEEWYDNFLYEYWELCRPNRKYSSLQLINTLRRFINLARKSIRNIKYSLNKKHLGWANLIYMEKVSKLLKNNPNSINIMVSEYSKSTMIYNFNIAPERILVLYSPERIDIDRKPIENKKLKDMIERKEKFYLLLSCDRDSKNPYKCIDAFIKYTYIESSAYLVTVGLNGGGKNKKVISLDFLTDSDLSYGFGYPPIEAMRYGKPVLSSNTTSMPEILGDAPIYFSPIYKSAIFQAFLRLNDRNYSIYKGRSLKQYQAIKERQEKDLGKLIDIILENSC